MLNNMFGNNQLNIRKAGLVACAVLTILAGAACNTTKKAAVTEPEKPAAANERKPEEYLSQMIDWNTFSGKADMHFENKDQNQDFTGNLRMNKGKDIWASIIALGITEVARASITPDSLRAMVKIGKKAYALSYEEGLELIQAQVEFPVLQNLFIGNPLISGTPVVNAETKDTAVWITQEKEGFTQLLGYGKISGLLQEQRLHSEQKGFTCTIRYEKYGPVTGKQPFAFNRRIVINNKGEEVKLDMEFSRAELNTPVETNFSIPDSYERLKIKKQKS